VVSGARAVVGFGDGSATTARSKKRRFIAGYVLYIALIFNYKLHYRLNICYVVRIVIKHNLTNIHFIPSGLKMYIIYARRVLLSPSPRQKRGGGGVGIISSIKNEN
jgi:hypothetical protein